MSDQPRPPNGAPGSGLRNPDAAVRGLGMATLLLEALALLMAVLPLWVLDVPAVAVVLVVTLAAVAVVLATLLRIRMVWYLPWALNGAVIATGWFQWAVAALGVAFGLAWWYVLHVRRAILGRQPPAA